MKRIKLLFIKNIEMYFRVLLLSLLFSQSSFIGICQIVNIPDVNFKNYLVNNVNINTNSDNEIQVSEAAAFSLTIDVTGLNISDLTGIEAFTAVDDLICDNNNITTLDVSTNTALRTLGVFSNQLTSLNVTGLTSLLTLGIQHNSLTSLDVSTNTALTGLYCSDNLLTSLNLSNNIALTQLVCSNNLLTNLDISVNTALDGLSCSNNQLTNLNVKNGNNTNMNTFYANNNPNLTCIEVDNVAWANTNWTVIDNNIDPIASFSENCTTGITDNLNTLKLAIYPNPATTEINVSGYSPAYLKLCNAVGQTVAESKSNKLYIGNLSQGLYVLQLFDANGQQVKTEKVIVAK